MPVNLNSKYQPLFTTQKRYILITGGRGSGKSFGTTCFQVLLTKETNHKILFTRWTMTSAEISIIPEFNQKISAMNLEHEFISHSTDVTNRLTGSAVLFRGVKTSSGNQTANLKSIEGITTWTIDEGEEFVDENVFDTIDLSVRTPLRQNRVIIILNPTDKNHWIWKRWFENSHRIEVIDGCEVQISTHPDVEHIHTTYLDNLPNLDANFVRQIRELKETDFQKYRHRIIGAWATEAEGTLYKQSDLQRFKMSELRADEREYTLGYIDVADEGTDSHCYVLGYIYRNAVYIVDVIHTPENIDVTLPLSVAMFKRHNSDYVRVESNNAGGGFIRAMRQYIEPTRILPVNSRANKHTRIIMEYDFVKRYFRFLDKSEYSSDSQYAKFINEILEYKLKKGETKDKDDAPDALSGLSKFIRGYQYTAAMFDPIPLENI